MELRKEKEVVKKPSLFMRFLNRVEIVGNKLPDPVTIFVILWFLIIGISVIVANSGVTAVHPGTGETVAAVNLLSKEQMQLFLKNVVSNFTSFAPLGLVLVTMLGAGLAEKVGISCRHLQRLEQNEENTRISTFKKIVKSLEIPDDEILKFIKK